MFSPLCLCDIYAFCKGLKRRDAEEVNLPKKSDTPETSEKFRHNASTAGKEAALGKSKIYRQDALWQSYLSF